MRPYWWLWRARRQKRRAPADSFWDERERLIRRLAPGRSFIDAGGMFGVHGRAAFLAEKAGASEVVLYDAMDPSDEFRRRREREGSSVRYVQGDLHDPRSVADLGTFDVVWCAGVIYHSPNPFLLLEHLRRLATGELVLGTHLIPELPGWGACLSYPGLPERQRRAIAWAHGNEASELVGVGAPFTEELAMGYVNFWWGFSLSASRSMLAAARFEAVEENLPHPLFVDIRARARPGESLIPPTAFARERGERRAATPTDAG